MARTDPCYLLIVDDDRSVQRLLADALTRQGFVVAVERDGEWALRTFEKRTFDAVLLDLLLPGMNGYEVARKIKATPKGKRTPIVMISGIYTQAIQQKEAVQKHGAFALLPKPLKLQDLYETLQQALGDRYPSAEPPPPPVPLDDDDDTATAQNEVPAEAQDEIRLVEQQTRRHTSETLTTTRGDLSQKGFSELIAEIHRWRGSGALLMRREKAKKIIYFREGVPVFVKSNLLSECLGQVLVREKMISNEECEESLRRSKKSKRLHGTVLIEMGCLSPHNLQYALQLQLRSKVLDVFAWKSGEYQFNPKAEIPSETVDLGQSAAQLILEGVRRTFDEPRLTATWGNVAGKFVHPAKSPLLALQEAGLGEEELQLLHACDGYKTVATLRALAILPKLDTDRLLYAMHCAQLIELRDEPAKGRPAPSILRLAESATTLPEVPAMPPPAPPPQNPPPLPLSKKMTLPPPLSKKSLPVAPPKTGLAVPWQEDVPKLPAPKASARRIVPAAVPSFVTDPGVNGGRRSLMPELSAVVSTSKLSNDESQVREKLAKKLSDLRQRDLFGVLGLAPDANREEVKRAYFGLAKEFHPDRHFHSSSAEVRALAQQIYELISQAHDTLSDTAERERYLRELAKGKKRELGDEVSKILAAEGRFQKGEELMRARLYDDAHRCFDEAIRLYGEEGEFHAWWGWSLFQTNPKDAASVERALSALEKAISLNPKVDKSYLFLGYLHKALGRPDKAEKQFEKAIQCNPDCTEALRELRLLGKQRR